MDTQAEVSIARIRLWLVRAYLKDLQAFYGGDVNRFGRMVDGKGGGLGSADKWVGYINAFLNDELVVTHTPEAEMISIMDQVAMMQK